MTAHRDRQHSRALTQATAEALAAGQVHFPPNGFWDDFFFYVANNHIVLSIFFAHPAHPYTRWRRFFVLLNSLCFAFLVVAVVQSMLGGGIAGQLLGLTVGTVLQLCWDLPTSMLGQCSCANARCLPKTIRVCFRFVSFALIVCRTVLAIIFALLGMLLVVIWPHVELSRVATDFGSSKMFAFVSALPFMLVIFIVLRHCEMASREHDSSKRYVQV
mmetsp:Transcript_46526/g.76907  ORF Transcript_46526/g.76907 Transcript_46526/m.76907 type:complete len:216 (-) Transcript_46526:34-681(-)